MNRRAVLQVIFITAIIFIASLAGVRILKMQRPVPADEEHHHHEHHGGEGAHGEQHAHPL